MDFGWSEEQLILQDTIRTFALAEFPTTRLRQLFDEGSGHDPELWAAFVEMGIAGLVIPEEEGGAGLELLDLALVAEILGEAAMPGPFLGHSLAALGVRLAADADQRSRILPRLASGDAIATVALQEGERGWAPEDWTVSVDGDRISGIKTFVMHADIADHVLVGLEGGTMAWVAVGGEGVEVEPIDGIDRTRHGSAVVTLYRWRTPEGQWQISDTPPPEGARYETVSLRHDTNVLPAPKADPDD